MARTPPGTPDGRRALTAAIAMCIAAVLVGSGLAGASDTAVSHRGSGKVDKHALPLGDGKVTTSGPKRGWIYVCQTSNQPAGAFQDGPWINTTNDTYDVTQKVTVDGSVEWPQASFSEKVQGDVRQISGNDL